MKKISELIRPFVCVIFGALLLLFYLNWLSGQGVQLGIGITAVAMAAYYLTVGVLGIALGDKLSGGARRILDIISISLFPLFMFVYFLVVTINAAQAMGPTGWVIAILSMIGALTFSIVYIVASLINVKWLTRLCMLFGSVFVLVLLTNVLFDVVGNPIVLGNINIIGLVIYLVYTYMLINALFANKPEEKSAQD